MLLSLLLAVQRTMDIHLEVLRPMVTKLLLFWLALLITGCTGWPRTSETKKGVCGVTTPSPISLSPTLALRGRGPESPIMLENDSLRIALDGNSGNLLSVENNRSGFQLIQYPAGGPAWRLQVLEAAKWIEDYTAFTWTYDQTYAQGQAVNLRWTTDLGFTIEGRVELAKADLNACFFVNVLNEGDHSLDKIEYPIIQGIGNLSNDTDSCLVHSQGTGFLFHDPYRLFEPVPGPRQGLRYSPYPEGFSGSTMQFMAYYAQGKGGFYLAAHDPSKAMKWLNFFKGQTGDLESTFIHQSPDISPGQGLRVPYPVIIGALFEGTWYEAADRYKAWASQQSWTSQGPLWGRQDRSRWLLDEVGFATFGVNASHDRSAWLDRFHAITEGPVFHVLGVNWPKTGADYRNNLPGGRDDWFPASFSEANLETIRKNGDYWAPFEFDLLLSPYRTENREITDSLLALPREKYSFDQYNFPFICPATSYLPELHRWRDERLVAGYGCDALYYDISANNVLMACRNRNHGHPVGGGTWMVDAYCRMYADTKSAATKAKGAYVPQGTEMISEVFIPYMDFYQARAEASPLSSFEADFFRDWIKQGLVEKIPLFTYVYHEYGPVRLDGWGKLSPEVGELFYWVASRVALWGGLFELNYEFSPLEIIDSQAEDPSEHYYDFERRAYGVDPAKVAFVREIAAARTGFARDYLVYGTMIRPLSIEAPEVELDYFLYNVPRDLPHYGERGTLRVPSVVHVAWRYRHEKIGLLFVNLQKEGAQEVTLDIDLANYGFAEGGNYGVELITAVRHTSLPNITGKGRLHLTLPPRRVVLLEIRPVGS